MTDNEHVEPHIAEKFLLQRKLGEGAYGHVWKAKCKKTGKMVALKKIFDAFQHATDSQRTFREISILKQLNHPHIISLLEVIESQNNRDIYLVFQYMESDLYRLIYEGTLQNIHIKYILYQILLGLHYLHHSKLIHRDLKPSNILLNSDCSAKICDFGLVRYLEEQNSQNILTQGVATRWYRAPQVLLGSNSYNWQADMWSIGCIIAQILLKSPLFPGKCTTDQLEKIIQFTGKPSKADIKSLKTQLAEVMINEISISKFKKKQIFSMVEDKDAIALIHKLLQFNPEKRFTTEEALKHCFFKQFFNAKDLQVKKENITMFVNENVKLKSTDYITLIRQKFTEKNDSFIIKTPKIAESPTCFSDLKRNRNGTGSKSKLKYESKEKKERTCNLFQELCRQKSSKKQNHRKDSSRKKSQNKENIHQNSLSSATKTPIARFTDQKIAGSFNGLRKVSRVPR